MENQETHKVHVKILTTSPLHRAATSSASPSTPLNFGRITDNTPWPLLFCKLS